MATVGVKGLSDALLLLGNRDSLTAGFVLDVASSYIYADSPLVSVSSSPDDFVPLVVNVYRR